MWERPGICLNKSKLMCNFVSEMSICIGKDYSAVVPLHLPDRTKISLKPE